MGGLHPVVVFWTGWGIHVTVLVSFTVQVTLLLLSDIRRRKDWTWLKVVIWSAYTLADTTAVYALGHMSVLCTWSPEHHLMALWAPLLLVHMGGQDNITAYAMEDNRLWVRHFQTFVVQVVASGYVLRASSILSHPSKLGSAAILMLVVGFFKYGERIWALMRADSCCSSSLSPTSYDDSCRPTRVTRRNDPIPVVLLAHLLLDFPKQMFEGPTSNVDIRIPEADRALLARDAKVMLDLVKMQLWMMYDLLYTKANIVHTWYVLCSRVIYLLLTVAALALFYSSLSNADDKASAVAATYSGADVVITKVLLVGAVVLETMSVLRAIFSKWTAVLLYSYGKEWDSTGDMVFSVVANVSAAMQLLRRLLHLGKKRSGNAATKRRGTAVKDYYWLDSGRMRQYSLFYVSYGMCRMMAKRMGVEDLWDSNVYPWSTDVPEIVISKVLELVSKSTQDTPKPQDLNAVQRCLNNQHLHLPGWIWMEPPVEFKLEERILVWHIATHVYIFWDTLHPEDGYRKMRNYFYDEHGAAYALANYMFFLLASRPYMLPYPVNRQPYLQLCSDAVNDANLDIEDLVKAVFKQKENLIKGSELQPEVDMKIRNSILDRGCQLAAKLIHITATPPKQEKKDKSTSGEKKRRQQTEETVDGITGKPHITATPPKQEKKNKSTSGEKKQRQQTEERVDGIMGKTEQFSFSVGNGDEVVLNKLEPKVVLNMVLEVWVEMLCYTAYFCNENFHGKHLTDGGEIMSTITLLMIYVKNGLIRQGTSTSGTAEEVAPSSPQTTATHDMESGQIQ